MKNQQEIARLKHDLKNVLLHVSYHLESERTEEAKEELRKLLELKGFAYEPLSGCVPIDAILGGKIERIRQSDISCKLELQIPRDLIIEHTIDLAAILGNLVDNAFEAVMRLNEDSPKTIEIHIKFNDGKLFIRVVNSSKFVETDFTRGALISEKGRKRYGIGLSSINERVGRLNGYYDFSYQNGYFNSIVVLPIQMERQKRSAL